MAVPVLETHLKGERVLAGKSAIERRGYPPGRHGRRRARLSEHRLQLREKQKAKRFYGLRERQFVVHGHIRVNGERVDVPSHRLEPGDAVSLVPGTRVEPVVRRATDLTAIVPPWIEADHEQLSGTVLRRPERHEIDAPVDEKLIVEHYSR